VVPVPAADLDIADPEPERAEPGELVGVLVEARVEAAVPGAEDADGPSAAVVGEPGGTGVSAPALFTRTRLWKPMTCGPRRMSSGPN
jgi:hypothetical protein